MTTFDLGGKVAVISGASRGMGEAIAWSYVRAGARVVIGSRKTENIQPIAEAINGQYKGFAVAATAHAGSREDTKAMIKLAIQEYGQVDIAVCNAGTNPHFGPILTAEESHWDKILEVNVKGTFWMCQLAAQQMLAQGNGGKIIIMSSITGFSPGLMMGVYSVSKAAVIMLTKSLAMELGPNNIQVNAIAPGFIKTKFSRALWGNPAVNDSIVKRTPAGRLAEPDEVTGIALYLASSASDFTTGAVFTVDGGYALT